jgi:hypothetical protein
MTTAGLLAGARENVRNDPRLAKPAQCGRGCGLLRLGLVRPGLRLGLVRLGLVRLATDPGH